MTDFLKEVGTTEVAKTIVVHYKTLCNNNIECKSSFKFYSNY